MAIAGGPAPADICYTGTWEIKFSKSDVPSLSLHYPAGYSNWSGLIALGCLGLADSDMRGAMRDVDFELSREAGTFSCSGMIGEGIANGTFRFHPNDAWAASIQGLGLRCSLGDQIVAAMGDVQVSYVADIVKAGLRITSVKSLCTFHMKGFTPQQAISLARDFPDADTFSVVSLITMQSRMDDAHALHEALPNATIEEVMLLGMSGAGAEFIRALQNAGTHDLTAANVLALRSVGIDQEFVDRAAAAGKTGLSIDEFVELKRTGF